MLLYEFHFPHLLRTVTSVIEELSALMKTT
jgi:hypothetical protein